MKHEADGKKWGKYYMMPAQADRAPIAFRKWWDKVAESFPFSPEDSLHKLPRKPDHEKILDRYKQHTQHCPSCSKMLKRSRTGQTLCKAVATAIGVAWLLAVTRDTGVEPVSWTSAAAAAGIAASLGLSNVLHFLERKFTYTDYIHAERG
jgi:hypothetical protein